jgi:catechol 2,3-dioxygenase-like lactoylglutathione lyase family enzyme
MRQAASFDHVSLDPFLPGIEISTGPVDYDPIKDMQLMRFEGASWKSFGPLNVQPVFMRIPGNRPRPFQDIIQFLDPPIAGEAYPTLHNVGIGRLCFEVDDVVEVARVLEEHEVPFTGPISRYETAKGVRPHGINCEFLCFKDPDGTVLEYIQFIRQSRSA